MVESVESVNCVLYCIFVWRCIHKLNCFIYIVSQIISICVWGRVGWMCVCVFFYVFALCCLYCAIIFMYLFSAYAHHYVFFMYVLVYMICT